VSPWADHLIGQGKPEEAIAVYREAITREGGGKHVYRLSRLLVDAKRRDEAIEIYQQAIATKPKDINLHKSLANLYGEIGKPAERIVQLNKLVELYLDRCNENPESGCRQSLVFTLQSLGKREQAYRQYRILLSRKKNTPTILNSDAMGFAHLQKRIYGMANSPSKQPREPVS
jgi:tetratricopeptide (TPR) repeat protein